MNEYLNVMRTTYANFSGRARRREYRMFTLVNTVILILLQIPVQGAVIALAAQAETDTPGSAGFAGITLVFAVLLLIYALAVLVPSIAVTVRRLHDTGKSGWWYLLNLIPLGSLVVLVFCVMEGEPGTNRWGPNPKGQTSAVTANTW